MSRQWKPGDVALCALDDTPVLRVVSRQGLLPACRWSTVDGELVSIDDGDLRPLVVINPEDRAAVEALRDAYDVAFLNQNPGAQETPEWKGKRGNALQAALRSRIAPPKPEEPHGSGAVVEDREVEWVHVGDGVWIKSDPLIGFQKRLWPEFSPAVRVLHLGRAQ